MNVIGPQLKRLREQNHMTQEEMTAQCNLIGWNISRGTLAKVESQVVQLKEATSVLLVFH